MRRIVILIAFALAAYGQRHKIETVDAEKPEGKLLQQAMQEEDAAKRMTLFEQFAQQFPKDDSTPWVLEQLQTNYAKAGDSDKTIAAGEKLLALDPDDPDAALQALKASEAKKDPELIKKWSLTTSTLAKKAAAAPKPSDAEQAEYWKSQVDYAKQVDTYAGYAVYKAAAESRDPKVMINLSETVIERDPKGEYAAKLQGSLFLAYRQAGQNDKALALAERVIQTDQSNEDMLLVVTDNYLQRKAEPEKVHAYSAKIVEVMQAKPKPEGVSDADWTNRKNLVVGLAHYMSGKLYYTENKFAPADQELRAALPGVEANPALKPEVLYLLGFANYKLDKPQDAANYYRDCSALKSQFQALAAKNLQGIKAQYRGIK